MWKSRCIWTTLIGALVANSPAALAQEFRPPTNVFLRTDFDAGSTTPIPQSWQVDDGQWAASAGTYNVTSVAPRSISTLFEYPIDPAAPQSELSGPFTYRARISHPGGSAGKLAGVVYNFVNLSNYYEAAFSPNGTVQLRAVRSGIPQTVASAAFDFRSNEWFDVEIVRTADKTTLNVNGVTVLSGVAQTEFQSGRLGLITRGTRARFDKVAVAVPFGPQSFRETFSPGLTQRWQTTPGWVVANGTFNSTQVSEVTRAAAPAGTELTAGNTIEYTFRSRMLNPYRGPGNQVGMFFHDTGSSRAEVLFAPNGVAKLNVLSEDGTTRTIATAGYDGRQNQWFDVRLDSVPGATTISVDGVTLFDRVNTNPAFEGGVGLITRWAPGKFDDVWYDNIRAFQPLTATFDTPLPQQWIVSGTWGVSGGMLFNGSIAATQIVATACACWNSDIALRARLRNEYDASGNQVGLIYNYQRDLASDSQPYAGFYAGDYYEVVFAATGQAFINKVLNGVRYRVASGTHNVPLHASFDVEVLRQGTTTTVKVNGLTVFDRVPQGQLSYGDVGVVTHWAPGRFDNLTVTDLPAR